MWGIAQQYLRYDFVGIHIIILENVYQSWVMCMYESTNWFLLINLIVSFFNLLLSVKTCYSFQRNILFAMVYESLKIKDKSKVMTHSEYMSYQLEI